MAQREREREIRFGKKKNALKVRGVFNSSSGINGICIGSANNTRELWEKKKERERMDWYWLGEKSSARYKTEKALRCKIERAAKIAPPSEEQPRRGVLSPPRRAIAAMGGEGSTHNSETLEATTFVPIESRRFSRKDGVALLVLLLHESDDERCWVVWGRHDLNRRVRVDTSYTAAAALETKTEGYLDPTTVEQDYSGDEDGQLTRTCKPI